MQARGDALYAERLAAQSAAARAPTVAQREARRAGLSDEELTQMSDAAQAPAAATPLVKFFKHSGPLPKPDKDRQPRQRAGVCGTGV